MIEISDKQKEYFSENFKSLVHTGNEFVAADFEGCEFLDCDFHRARFIECKFTDCTFTNCNLSLMKIDESEFTNVEFHHCKILGVDWTAAYWPKLLLFIPFKFFQCILNDSSFFGLKIEKVVFRGCKACYTDFREGCFKNADFRSTELTNSLFNQTDLTGADFNEAVNYNIDIYSNKISGAKFNRFEAVRLLECIGIEIID